MESGRCHRRAHNSHRVSLGRYGLLAECRYCEQAVQIRGEMSPNFWNSKNICDSSARFQKFKKLKKMLQYECPLPSEHMANGLIHSPQSYIWIALHHLVYLEQPDGNKFSKKPPTDRQANGRACMGTVSLFDLRALLKFQIWRAGGWGESGRQYAFGTTGYFTQMGVCKC